MAGGFVGLIALGGKASPDLLVSAIADGATALLIVLAMTFGLILPKMCIEHSTRVLPNPIIKAQRETAVPGKFKTALDAHLAVESGAVIGKVIDVDQ